MQLRSTKKLLVLKMNWTDLDYWQSKEWQVVKERLDDLDRKSVLYNPSRKLLFRALDITPFEKVRVAIIGQDPYPHHQHATGVAFDVPPSIKRDKFPPTLLNIFEEYKQDLHYPDPDTGSLHKWARQGVLLWNAIPSCEAGKPASHHWTEWSWLTKEIIEKLDREGCCVFVLLGNYAKKYNQFIFESDVIETSHPSPLGAKFGFTGSRVFSTTNGFLVEAGLEPVDWKL